MTAAEVRVGDTIHWCQRQITVLQVQRTRRLRRSGRWFTASIEGRHVRLHWWDDETIQLVPMPKPKKPCPALPNEAGKLHVATVEEMSDGEKSVWVREGYEDAELGQLRRRDWDAEPTLYDPDTGTHEA